MHIITQVLSHSRRPTSLLSIKTQHCNTPTSICSLLNYMSKSCRLQRTRVSLDEGLCLRFLPDCILRLKLRHATLRFIHPQSALSALDLFFSSYFLPLMSGFLNRLISTDVCLALPLLPTKREGKGFKTSAGSWMRISFGG